MSLPVNALNSIRLIPSIRGSSPYAKILKSYIWIDISYDDPGACQTFVSSTRPGQVLHGESTGAKAPRRMFIMPKAICVAHFTRAGKPPEDMRAGDASHGHAMSMAHSLCVCAPHGGHLSQPTHSGSGARFYRHILTVAMRQKPVLSRPG